jgi:hypothetical protein
MHVAMSCHVRHSMSLSLEDPAPVAIPGTEKGPRYECRGPEYISSQVTRRVYNGQIGGEILHVHGYRFISMSSSF